MYKTKPCTLEYLEIRTHEVLNNNLDDILQKVVYSTPGRLRKIVKASDAYVKM